MHPHNIYAYEHVNNRSQWGTFNDTYKVCLKSATKSSNIGYLVIFYYKILIAN